MPQNHFFGGPKGSAYDPTNEKPDKLRLAWMFTFQKDAFVWIDAVDGKILGGYDHMASHKERLKTPRT